jgi:hypothetical protein
MKTEITLNMVEKELKKLGLHPDAKEYIVGLTMLGALAVGANADSVARFIQQPRRTVREIAKRLRKNKIWQGNKTCCRWFEKDGSMEFCLDCACGMGWIEKIEVEA